MPSRRTTLPITRPVCRIGTSIRSSGRLRRRIDGRGGGQATLRLSRKSRTNPSLVTVNETGRPVASTPRQRPAWTALVPDPARTTAPGALKGYRALGGRSRAGDDGRAEPGRTQDPDHPREGHVGSLLRLRAVIRRGRGRVTPRFSERRCKFSERPRSFLDSTERARTESRTRTDETGSPPSRWARRGG